MKIELTVTSISKLVEGKFLVQFQGPQGTAQLNVSEEEAKAIRVSTIYILEPLLKSWIAAVPPTIPVGALDGLGLPREGGLVEAVGALGKIKT